MLKTEAARSQPKPTESSRELHRRLTRIKQENIFWAKNNVMHWRLSWPDVLFMHGAASGVKVKLGRLQQEHSESEWDSDVLFRI
jgi:hypothetical protein